MPHRLSVLLALSLCLSQPAAAGTDFDLQVCMAHSDRTSQIKCCEEMGIQEARCTRADREDREEARSTSHMPNKDKFFYCKTWDLDGSSEITHKWGNGTDFTYMPEKNLWEWRSEYSVRSIDVSGGFYETSLIKNGIDRIGECDPAYKWQYEKKREAIKQKYGN